MAGDLGNADSAGAGEGVEEGVEGGVEGAGSDRPRKTRAGQSWASSEGVRASMRANRSRDTGPELALRRAVHGRGLRYRVAARPVKELRRTADLVFTKARVAVFLDGCFWHGCPEHHTGAVRNADYWAAKVEQNRNRAADTDRRLDEAGWTVVRVWEHENPLDAADRVEAAVIEARRAAARRPGPGNG
ncbi:very short patch repair endonuclease [Streptomyces jumonjinensis]|uniref:Very short patch repair endonuclease n=1 Tax=Streptomyces jumonjinensis TaxID=1945 RepID=A0A646KCZ6_STRJU|nr:very short patch repair endonuclease [Streptomyces jumonjinensis]MQT00113.1 very short patch repair endonuclease [Streptomyces jumonjinensis]